MAVINDKGQRIGRPTKKQARDLIDPRKVNFIKYFLDANNKKTYGNVTQSALAAGYTYQYAKLLASPSINLQWLREMLQPTQELVTTEEIITGIKSIATKRKALDKDKLAAWNSLAKVKRIGGYDNRQHSPTLQADTIHVHLGAPAQNSPQPAIDAEVIE